MDHSCLLATLSSLILVCASVGAADLTQVVRKIAKEPTYKSKPKYCLLVFGPEAKTRVWVVQDGDTMYVDRNGDGDLTEPGKKVTADKIDGPDEGEYFFHLGDICDGARLHKALFVSVSKIDFLSDQYDEVNAVLTQNITAWGYGVGIDVEMPDWKGTGVDNRVRMQAAYGDANGLLRFGDRPQDAPIIHFGGLLQVTLFRPQWLMLGREKELFLGVGAAGVGAGTTAFLEYEGVIPRRASPRIEITYPPKKPGQPPVQERYELRGRC